MIVVTGGDGFIGKNLVNRLLEQDNDVIILDTKNDTLNSISNWLKENYNKIECIYHLGANTDTTETDVTVFNTYNLSFSIYIWNFCSTHNISLVYASSAATYGDGEHGFDDEKSIENLKPLNPYGWSKQEFDVFVEHTKVRPPFWAGLKFFNVYGYGESHKGGMASVVYHTYNQIKESGEMKLFKSHRDDYNHGEQKRDFIYVGDVVDICINIMKNKPKSGIYNVGTGIARSYNELVKAVFKTLNVNEKIVYIDIPDKIRVGYQYFTEAKNNKLVRSGCSVEFHELEEGISKYINKLIYENR